MLILMKMAGSFRSMEWLYERTYRPKHCGNNNKDEDNGPKTLNDENHQASSQKFRQQINIPSNL